LDTYKSNLQATPVVQGNNPYVKRSVNTSQKLDTQQKEKWAATMIPNQHKPQSHYGSTMAKPGHIFDERLENQNRFAATDRFNNRNASPQPQRHQSRSPQNNTFHQSISP